ncbi:adenosine receptor A3 [Hydra vulgaris]|uniref:adenosine receptor A3 n=1 Tax=Hydra vulgaris TaxID=6087 RepID=UPI001F5F376D|nr:adenosine receptor A3 [Hydra vulgaris]
MEKRITVIILIKVLTFAHSSNVSVKSYYITEVCNRKTEKTYFSVFVILLIMIPITTLGNTFVVIVIGFTPKLRKNTTYFVLLSLAFADFLVGCITVPINAKRVYNNKLFCLSKYACISVLYMECFLSIASMTHLFSIAIERYLSLKIPFQFTLSESSASIYKWLLSVWAYAFFWSFLGIFKWNKSTRFPIIKYIFNYSSVVYDPRNGSCISDNQIYFTTVYVVCFCLPAILMGYIYYFVYKTTLRHIHQISQSEIGELNLRTSRRKLRQQKLFTSVFIVFLVYISCWLPTFVFLFLKFYNKNLIDQFKKKQPLIFQITVIIVGEILPPLNSALNPVIYVMHNKKFRTSAQLILNKICFKRIKRKNATAMAVDLNKSF